MPPDLRIFRDLFSTNAGRGLFLLTVATGGGVMNWATIEVGKPGRQLPGLNWLPFVCYSLGQVFGVGELPESPQSELAGIVYPVVLVPAILVNHLLFDGKRVRPSPSQAYTRFSLYILLAIAAVCLVTTFWPIGDDQWSNVNVAFQLSPLFLVGPAMASTVLGRTQAEPKDAKAAADAHRQLSIGSIRAYVRKAGSRTQRSTSTRLS